MSTRALSIIIPAYNEEQNVAGIVREASDVAQQLQRNYEIIVVNDGSTDGTRKKLLELMWEIPHLKLVEHHPNLGYGAALKAGFSAASKELIVFAPADGQFTFTEIDRFLTMSESADIVCGYRANRQDNMMRRLSWRGWNALVRLFFGNLCRDIDCGFKLIRRNVVEQVPLLSDGAMIDTELLAGARARGFRVAEVPVTHLPRNAGEATGANPRVILKAFRDLVQFRLRLRREMREAHSSPPRGRSWVQCGGCRSGRQPSSADTALPTHGGF